MARLPAVGVAADQPGVEVFDQAVHLQPQLIQPRGKFDSACTERGLRALAEPGHYVDVQPFAKVQCPRRVVVALQEVAAVQTPDLLGQRIGCRGLRVATERSFQRPTVHPAQRGL